VLLSGRGDGQRGAGQLLRAGGDGGGGSGEAEGGGHRGRHSRPAVGNDSLEMERFSEVREKEEIERAEWIRREKSLSLSLALSLAKEDRPNLVTFCCLSH
jgi:hypothetical protein